MSAAAAATVADGAAPKPKKGKNKLLVIAAVALLVIALAAGGAVFFLKKRAAEKAEAEAAELAADAHDAKPAKPDLKHPPTFLPLDPFVVNLADKEADRYAQVGITLELEDGKFAEQLKAYMPAIRNAILMILAHKNSHELLDRAGKTQLAAEIQRETARTMGIEVEDPEPAAKPPIEAHADSDDEAPAATKKSKAGAKTKAEGKAAVKKAASEPNPVRKVHFANFIVQ